MFDCLGLQGSGFGGKRVVRIPDPSQCCKFSRGKLVGMLDTLDIAAHVVEMEAAGKKKHPSSTYILQ